MSSAKHLLIVYHSQSGSTASMADAVIRGACHEDIDGVDVRACDALCATADDLLWVDGLILRTPENFGCMSGAPKYFRDRAYRECEDRMAGIPYALFARTGH